MRNIFRKSYIVIVLSILAGLLIGCADDTTEKPATSSGAEVSEENTDETVKTPSANELEEVKSDDAQETSIKSANTDSSSPENNDSNVSENEEIEALTDYSAEEIEYARVWLQLGANQAIDELYVQHIPAGTPINPNDDTSLHYPEDVIQLAGIRLVDGSVTYSGNGDGTINVYQVPLRWDGNYPAGEDFYKDIINHTKSVYIDPGNDEDVIELIKLLHIQ